MLNELLTIERGAVLAGIALSLRHPEIKDSAKNKKTLSVFLDADGHVAKVRAVPSSRLEEKPLWKLSEGKKNSFPFVQPKPLWDDATIESWKKGLSKKPSDSEKRDNLLKVAAKSDIRSDDLGEWASEGMIKSLKKRRQDLVLLEQSEVAALPAAIDRFIKATNKKDVGDPVRLTREIANRLIEELKVSADSDLLTTTIALLTESSATKGGAFYFEAEGDFPLSLIDYRIEDPLCTHLRQIDLEHAERRGETGICGVTGEYGPLVVGNFSESNLPYIGQTFLFARNDLIPSTSRYNKSSAASMSVGYMTDVRLRAAAEALSCESRKGKTWRAIPSEAPKQSDLLLAFVDQALDAPILGILTDNNEEEDLSEEESASPTNADSVAAFEKRTERLIEALKAKIQAEWRNTPVHLIIIRAVDTGNRKVVYAGTPTASSLYDAATEWAVGERNIPDWFRLWVQQKDDLDPHLLKPPHIAPLGLIKISKQIFLRNGTRPPGKKKEQPGLPASETVRLFLDVKKNYDRASRNRVERVLRMVMARRTGLIKELAHAQRRGWDDSRRYDSYEALRTISLLGVLLHKLNRKKEVYMNDLGLDNCWRLPMRFMPATAPMSEEGLFHLPYWATRFLSWHRLHLPRHSQCLVIAGNPMPVGQKKIRAMRYPMSS
jgi:hypothetical protein